MNLSYQIQAKAILELRRRKSPNYFYDRVPEIAKQYQAPKHLDPLVKELVESHHTPKRVCAHAPPRHGKTETVLLFIAHSLLLYPNKTFAYITYEANIARSKSRKARAWVEAQGISLLQGAQRQEEWRTNQGGGLISGGVGGPLTGQGVDTIILDDPYKNRAQAESSAYQRMLFDWWSDVAETRIEPGGSAFIFHTRWTTNDLIGHLTDSEDQRWSWLCMPALTEEPLEGRDFGSALWPERWSAEALEEKKTAVGPYTWASLYQGRPQPRGGSVFGQPSYYDFLPTGYRVAIGVDLAYTQKTKSDHSVAVVLAESQGNYYVLEIIRERMKAPAFAERLRHLKSKYPGAPFRWIASGTEAGAADFIKEFIPLTVDSASTDKFVRSIEVAADWNANKVFVPSEPRNWLPDFLDETSSFTGVNDLEDDQIDALAAAHRVLSSAAVRLPNPNISLPKRRI